MPREIIPNCAGGPYFAKVGWAQHGGVQVGVETDDDRSLFWTLLGCDQDERAKLGHALRIEFGLLGSDPADPGELMTRDRADEIRATNIATAEKLLNLLDVSTSRYTGVWAHLDREGCNRMIATLRRARDTAFGKDE